MASPTHAMAIYVFGRGDASQGDDPSQVGIFLYELACTTGTLHQVRCTDGRSCFYDPRAISIDPHVLWGRALLRDLTATKMHLADEVLTACGSDFDNLPEIWHGSCQEWVAGAVLRLEGNGLLGEGEGRFWRGQVGLSGDAMGERCTETGRVWVPAEHQVVHPGEIDERFSDEEERRVRMFADSPE